MADSVFISYPSQSSNDRKLLYEFLRNNGVASFWIDRDQITAGENIADRVRNGVRESRCCVLILNKYTLKSQWCMAEVGGFWATNKPTIIYPTEPRCDPPSFLQGILLANTPEEVLNAAKLHLSTTNSGDPLLNLLNRCGLASAFRIPVMDGDRGNRVEALIRTECESERPIFRLLASSGFNYLHPTGVVWRRGLGEAITSGKAELKAVLASPFSLHAIARARANGISHNQWDDRGLPEQLSKLLKQQNVTIHATGYPINCSLFFTRNAAFYDPYLWGRPTDSARTENNFWVFEFVKNHRTHEEQEFKYACFGLLEKHFQFLMDESISAQDILGDKLSKYEELKRRFQQRVQGITTGGHHDLAVSV